MKVTTLTLNYTITDRALFAVVNGNPFSLTSDHAKFAEIRDTLTAREELTQERIDKIEAMFNSALAASRYLAGNVKLDGNILTFAGHEVHGVVVDRIMAFRDAGLPFEPLIEFMKRLYRNPSKRSIDELYGFLETNKLPITENGFILGYKGVDDDWKDCHTHTVDNRIGAKPRMDRNEVDDNWRLLCSSGYHVGSESYAKGFGARTIIVKIDPADVVSVPDAGWKMRVCAYEVIAEYAGPLPPVVAREEKPYQKQGFVKRFLSKLFGRSTNPANAPEVAPPLATG